jgi:uncharacterized protein YdhG (YjbR/CyaY superfamily)
LQRVLRRFRGVLFEDGVPCDARGMVTFDSVDAYLAAQPAPARAVLRRVRSALRAAVPGAEERISYQIPCVVLPEGAVIYFAGWKAHFSVYPASAAVVEALAGELARYEVRKGTIRFPLDEPAPLRLLARIARLRAKEVREHAKAKRAAPKQSKRRTTVARSISGRPTRAR